MTSGQHLALFVTLETQLSGRKIRQKRIGRNVGPVTMGTILFRRRMRHPLLPEPAHFIVTGQTDLLRITPQVSLPISSVRRMAFPAITFLHRRMDIGKTTYLLLELPVTSVTYLVNGFRSLKGMVRSVRSVTEAALLLRYRKVNPLILLSEPVLMTLFTEAIPGFFHESPN